MPLSDAAAPCNWCIDVEMYRIADELNLPPDVSKVNLQEITKTVRYCIKCSLPFCPDHASPVDQVDACIRCLPFEDISEMKTPLISQDEGGTHVHKGYRLVPTGAGYKTLPKAISDLTDKELDAFITDKQNQISDVEKRRDYLRAAHSTAKLEKNEREIAVQRALRGIKVKMPIADPAKGIKITGQKGNGPIKGVAGSGGQSLDLAAFLKFAAEKMKDKKTGTTVPPSTASPKVAPEHVAVTNNASSVTAERGGTVPDAAPPGASLEEKARETEIEAILNEGEKENENPS